MYIIRGGGYTNVSCVWQQLNMSENSPRLYKIHRANIGDVTEITPQNSPTFYINSNSAVGIIIAEDAIFRNNKRDIAFLQDLQPKGVYFYALKKEGEALKSGQIVVVK